MTVEKADLIGDADYRAEDLADKLVGYLSCRPEKATRDDVTVAVHEWLKSQLLLLGVPFVAPLAIVRVGSPEDTGCHSRAGRRCDGYVGDGCRFCGRIIGSKAT